MFKAISRLTKKQLDMLITVDLTSVTLHFPYDSTDSVLVKVEWQRGTMIDYTESVLVRSRPGETRTVELKFQEYYT